MQVSMAANLFMFVFCMYDQSFCNCEVLYLVCDVKAF